jgi:hypothetical protein
MTDDEIRAFAASQVKGKSPADGGVTVDPVPASDEAPPSASNFVNKFILGRSGPDSPMSFGGPKFRDNFNLMGNEKKSLSDLPDPDFSAGGGGSTSGQSEENADLVRAGLEMNPYLGMSSGARPQFVEGEGESYAGVMGEDAFNEAFGPGGAPARRGQAMGELGELEREKSDAMASMYSQQAEKDTAAAASMQLQRQSDLAEEGKRQKQLEDATAYYSQDLADQGKFWTNPGNIIAAISFSLMPIFSNDPTVGVKLINQAVQQDMSNRQHAADATLGSLRSNLNGYHKIAGDRQAGDLLAQAEAHRMAAMEIGRVAQKFEGPISQKKAQVAIEDQKTREAALRIEAYNKLVHIRAQNSTRALHEARAGFVALGEGPKGTKTVAGAIPHGQGMGAVAPGPGGDELAKIQAAYAKDPHVLDGLSNKQADDIAINISIREQMQVHPGLSPAAALVKAKEKATEENGPKMEPLRKLASPMRRVAQLRRQMDIISRAENADGKERDGFLSWLRRNDPGGLVDGYEKAFSKDPSMLGKNSHAQLAALRTRAQRVLTQQIAHEINTARHDLYGASVSENEKKNAQKEIDPSSPFSDVQAWINDRDKDLQSERRAVMGTGSILSQVQLRKNFNYWLNNGNQHSVAVAPPPKGNK